MHSKVSLRNPNPNRPTMASHFLRALARIHRSRARQQPSSSPQAAAVSCGRRIRRAAYASMALAAGPRRVWSRAILGRLRRPAGPPALVGKKIREAGPQRRGNIKRSSHEEKLRRVIPGGRRMDLCSLLEETSDYVQCLNAQVLLMQRIADSICPDEISCSER